jgi:hypothetical protein
MWPHVAGPTRYGPSALIPDINPTFVEFWDYLPTPLEHVANSHTIQGITSEINIPEETPLDRAINSASESTLRAVIRAVCAKHDEARKEAESRLLAKRIDVTTDFKTGDSKIVPHFPRHGFRSACKKEFDVTTNTKQNCQYHPSRSSLSLVTCKPMLIPASAL